MLCSVSVDVSVKTEMIRGRWLYHPSTATLTELWRVDHLPVSQVSQSVTKAHRVIFDLPERCRIYKVVRLYKEAWWTKIDKAFVSLRSNQNQNRRRSMLSEELHTGRRATNPTQIFGGLGLDATCCEPHLWTSFEFHPLFLCQPSQVIMVSKCNTF